jgi:hypothetical protein
VVTVANGGDQTYNVEATVQEAAPVTATVGPNQTVEIPVPLHVPGTSFPFDVRVTGDNGFPEKVFETVFDCPSVVDIRLTTPAGTPVAGSADCPALALEAEPQHGTVQFQDAVFGGFVYTSDPGFVGGDSFDNRCLGAANTIGTVTITVTAAPAMAAPAAPVAAEPTFTG